jgi:hypothetical protein
VLVERRGDPLPFHAFFFERNNQERKKEIIVCFKKFVFLNKGKS